MEMKMEMRHRAMLAKTSVGELSARPTPGNLAGLLHMHTHTPSWHVGGFFHADNGPTK